MGLKQEASLGYSTSSRTAWVLSETFKTKRKKAVGYSSVVEDLPHMPETLGTIPSCAQTWREMGVLGEERGEAAFHRPSKIRTSLLRCHLFLKLLMSFNLYSKALKPHS